MKEDCWILENYEKDQAFLVLFVIFINLIVMIVVI